MHIHLTIEDDQKNIGEGPIQVGWFLTEDKASILYEPPYRMRSQSQTKHAKSASRCPAVLQLESRYFVINCPFDFHLRFERDAHGKPALVNVLGDQSPVRSNKLRELLTLFNEKEWRTAQVPILKLKLPYCFIADAVAYLTQLDAFGHYRKNPLPGTIFGGRFSIHIWPRPVMWAFEWYDTSKDLILKRGKPLFYCQFDGYNPSRTIISGDRTYSIQLTDAKLQDYAQQHAEYYHQLDLKYQYQFSGQDKIYGGAGENKLFGGYKNDYIEGGEDNDIIYGDSDILAGFDLNQLLYVNRSWAEKNPNYFNYTTQVWNTSLNLSTRMEVY